MRVMQFKLRAETPDSAALHPGYIGAHAPYENLRVVFVACSLICESQIISSPNLRYRHEREGVAEKDFSLAVEMTTRVLRLLRFLTLRRLRSSRLNSVSAALREPRDSSIGSDELIAFLFVWSP